MATPFDAVIDIALVTVDDYKLGKLINKSQEGFNTYVDGILISAIPNFTRTIRPLTYDIDAREFTIDLNSLEISILADLWVIKWFDKEINVSSFLQNKLQISPAFTTHSPAQNLKEKVTYVDGLREKVQQKMTENQLQYGNFTTSLNKYGEW